MRMTTDLGELIRDLRDARGYTRRELAEQSGVSLSQLEKVEAGHWNPGMGTFVKLMVELDVNITLYNGENTVHEKSMSVIEDIFLSCSEGEVKYLVHMVKCLAEGFSLMG